MPRGDNPNSRANLALSKGFKDTDLARRAKQKSDEAKLRKRSFREKFEAALAADSGKLDEDGNRKTVKDEIADQIVNRAMKGNTRAFELIRDTIGEKPVDTVQVIEPDFSELDSIEF